MTVFFWHISNVPRFFAKWFWKMHHHKINNISNARQHARWLGHVANSQIKIIDLLALQLNSATKMHRNVSRMTCDNINMQSFILTAHDASLHEPKNKKFRMSLTKHEQWNIIKGERSSSIDRCSKLSAEIDLFSFRLSKGKSHDRDMMSAIVEKVENWFYIKINK